MQPCGVWKTPKVPAAKVAEVVAGYQVDNPTKIDQIDNHDGTFDVVATFPACSNGSATNQPPQAGG